MSPDAEPPASRDEFKIAIVCALALEFDAVVTVLDQVWNPDNGRAFGKAPGDLNTYVNGRIQHHNVVLVLLPQRMGKTSAAIVASDLRHSYSGLRLALLVGICGGVPKAGSTDILLGDVVISNLLVQYDFGRQYPDGFHRKHGPRDDLAGPNKEVRGMLAILATEYGQALLRQQTASCLEDLQRQGPKYACPGIAEDRLFQPEYRHKHRLSPMCQCQQHQKESDPVCEAAMETSCEGVGCDDSFLVKRRRHEAAVPGPFIHIGPVASGDTVMKSGVTRDKIAAKEGVIAFEMEGAGIWEHVPCLVVKGVCDYADSHKSKQWQDYAAATAAAAAKAVLLLHTPTERTRAVSSAFPNLTLPSQKWVVPFPPDSDHIDRPDISAWLGERWRLPGARVALVGLGGIGKSQLAIQFAHQVRDESHVFWINATTQDTFEESCRLITDRLGLASIEDTLDHVTRQIGGWLDQEQNGRWMVVLDNFDNCSVFGEKDPRLLRVLPQASHGFTLITSRALKAAERMAGSAKNIYSVPPMSEEMGLALFQTKLKDACEHEEGREVVNLLDHVPLAISQAAAYINRRTPRVSAREYVKMFRAGDRERTDLLSSEYDDLRRYHFGSNSVLGTWLITFDQIRHERPSALDLLSLMSFFSPQSIPETALKPWYDSDPEELPRITLKDALGPAASTVLSYNPVNRYYLKMPLNGRGLARLWDIWTHMRLDWKEGDKRQVTQRPEQGRKVRSSAMQVLLGLMPWSKKRTTLSWSRNSTVGPDEAFAQDLKTLLGYSLVASTARDGMFKMHPLVQHCTQGWLSGSQRREEWKRRFLLTMAINFSRIPRGPERRSLTSHLGFMLEENPRDPLTARLWITLSDHVATHWRVHGSPQAATELLHKMVDLGDTHLGSTNDLTVRCLLSLARHIHEQGDFKQAETLCRDLLRRTRKPRGSTPTDLFAESVIQYARVLRDLGQFNLADNFAETAVEQRMRYLGPRATSTLWTLANHAAIQAAFQPVDRFRFPMVHDMIFRVLQGDCTYHDAQQDTMGCLASIVLGSAEHPMTEEIERMLRDLVQVVERTPSVCRHSWFGYTAAGPFHRSLARYLENEGKVDEAKITLTRGIEYLSRVFPLPELEPPALVADLLACRDDKEEARRLMLEVFQNLSVDERVVFHESFRHEAANIGRCLYLQGRAEEGALFFDGFHTHVGRGYREKLGLADIPIQAELHEWHLGRCQAQDALLEQNGC